MTFSIIHYPLSKKELSPLFRQIRTPIECFQVNIECKQVQSSYTLLIVILLCFLQIINIVY